MIWRGKDAQDAAPLSVDTVPIYIQEKVNPQALIRDLRLVAKGCAAQANLFGDCDRIGDPEPRLDVCQHAENLSNRMILGDSLLVMNALAEKERLRGQVQMICSVCPDGGDWGVRTTASKTLTQIFTKCTQSSTENGLSARRAERIQPQPGTAYSANIQPL